MAGLTLFLAQRTALEAGDPVGVDPARDELAFFPLIYWPVVPGAPKPPQDAINRIDAYMKQGGTVLFDTRDAIEAPPGENGASQTPGMQTLARNSLLPRRARTRAGAARARADQDVLSAARFPRPLQHRARPGSRPCRARTTTTPPRARRAAATASRRSSSPRTISPAPGRIRPDGQPMLPLTPGEPRQREFAFRSGVNIVMYTLTGNYKADQVHAPALIERLGQCRHAVRHRVHPPRSDDRAVDRARRDRRDRGAAAARPRARRCGARRGAGADPAGARQSLLHPRGPRAAVLGRRRRDRQEPEPEFRHAQPGDGEGAGGAGRHA